MRVFPLEVRNGNEIWIKGLVDDQGINEDYEPAIAPDTQLILLGLNHALDSVDSIMDSLYEQLYDEYQINDALREHDVFVLKSCTFKNWAGEFVLPNAYYACISFHVISLKKMPTQEELEQPLPVSPE
jgi:hypothetical protein